jgi:signal transduction histidine kinase
MPGLTDYAQLAGLTLLAGGAHRDRAQGAMLGERDRIARDMHDRVILRLFATADAQLRTVGS